MSNKFYDPMDDILDRPIAFNPAFKKITGSTVAALFLSQAWYWTKRTNDKDGWFYKTQEEWLDETGLTRSEQETARKHLKRVGILEESRHGVPARLYYRLNKQNILSLLGFQYAGIQQSSMTESDEQESDVYSNINKNAETTTETTIQKRAKPASPRKDPNEILTDVKWNTSKDDIQALGDTFTQLIRNPMRSEFVFWRNGLIALKALGATPEALAGAIALAKKEWPDKIASPMSFKTSIMKFVGRQPEQQIDPERAKRAEEQARRLAGQS